jgi:hypothetical protein
VVAITALLLVYEASTLDVYAPTSNGAVPAVAGSVTVNDPIRDCPAPSAPYGQRTRHGQAATTQPPDVAVTTAPLAIITRSSVPLAGRLPMLRTVTVYVALVDTSAVVGPVMALVRSARLTEAGCAL